MYLELQEYSCNIIRDILVKNMHEKFRIFKHRITVYPYCLSQCDFEILHINKNPKIRYCNERYIIYVLDLKKDIIVPSIPKGFKTAIVKILKPCYL